MVAETEDGRENLMDFFDRISPLNLLPTETRTHVRASQKEMLLAFRSLVDEAIKYVEKSEKPRTKPRTRIEVQ